jgi:hypothetical protein
MIEFAERERESAASMGGAALDTEIALPGFPRIARIEKFHAAKV